MLTIQDIDTIRSQLESDLNQLINIIGSIQIGTSKQFPNGWGKAAKGRTVWRIIEEAINQNLEANCGKLLMESISASESEVSVYDTKVKYGNHDAYFNIKSAVYGGRTNKDDISKAIGLKAFFDEDINKPLFICTFVLNFLEDMTIEMIECYVMPTTWLPDIYVNPSNNGNLQSSKYKDLKLAVKRSNQEFYDLLIQEMEVATKKKAKKNPTL
jgi:hypothetical protein